MNKQSLTTCLLALSAAVSTYAAAPVVTWDRSDNMTDERGRHYIQKITLDNPSGVKMLCFNQFARTMKAITPGDTVVEIIPGYYYIASQRFESAESPVTIEIDCRGTYPNRSYMPDGFHVVMENGAVSGVELKRADESVRLPFLMYNATDRFMYGDSVYRRNEVIRGTEADRPGPFDIIPSFKSVTTTGKGYYTADKPVYTKIVADARPEHYKIILTPDKAVIEGVDSTAVKVARRVLDRRLLAANNGKLPCAVIEDWPDFEYRGMMIDISRNYQTPEAMNDLVEYLADYRFNRLHFHVTDDEAWRLEIPGLPELTEVGGRRGFTLDEKDYLVQIFTGNGNPKSKEGTSNGYFKRKDFIDLLRHCDSLGIKVIPEIESPGHARAAIIAMEARARRTGDKTYRLIEDGDTSRYSSAQAFHDNLMNPAVPGTYKFIDKVVEEIARMYTEAGVELPGIHLGGDEVPEGAWDGSASAVALAKELGVSGRHGLQGEYVKRIARMMAEKNIPLYGWEEIGKGYDDDFNREVSPTVGGVNCWHVAVKDPEKNVSRKVSTSGYPVILSNVDYFYVDQIYAPHPEEDGLMWGGIVDEFKTLGGYADVLCPGIAEMPGKVLGVQGQLFSETIRSYPMLQRFLFPKMFGIAERGWNTGKTYSEAQYNRIIAERELPRLASGGVDFHLRMPGIIEEAGLIMMNAPYEGGEIRYTVDGSEPDLNSPVYNIPFKPAGAKQIRARYYYEGKESNVSVLNIK